MTSSQTPLPGREPAAGDHTDAGLPGSVGAAGPTTPAGQGADQVRGATQSTEKAQCDHPDFEAQVIVTRLQDTGLFSADIKVWCKACALPFEFPSSIPMGLDLHGVARDLTGQELRIALRPATWPDVWSDRANAPMKGE